MSDSGQQVRGIVGHLVDAQEALENYIKYQPRDTDPVAAAIEDLKRARALIAASKAPSVDMREDDAARSDIKKRYRVASKSTLLEVICDLLLAPSEQKP